MAGGDNGQKIVQTYTDFAAPTGEGERYVTERGEDWRRVPRWYEPRTGERMGRTDGERIYER